MKKAILVISFGSSHIDAVRNSIEKIENKIKNEFKDFDVYRAFTAHRIIKKIEERDNIHINTPEEAFDQLYAKEYEQVIVLPLHIIPGEEYDYIKGITRRNMDRFADLRLARPILYYCGNEGVPNDYALFIESIKDVFEDEESVVLFGHGTYHHANSVYGMLQTMLQDMDYSNVFVATVEGYPSMESVIQRLKKNNIKKTKLVPILLVAGDHVKNDMAGDDDDSLKNILEREGIEVKLHMHGLGENDKFAGLYITRVYDMIEKRYEGIGRTKKLRKK